MGLLAWLRKWSQQILSSPPGRGEHSDEKFGTSSVPDGWTDDLTITVTPPRTLEELVDAVLAAEARRDDSALTVAYLIEQFGLSEEDAELALDRTMGGLVRAASGLPENRPSLEKDPVARISYDRCLRQPDFIRAIRP